MGNIGGVRKRGLTLARVEPVVRAVLEEWFPGCLEVRGPGDGWNSITFWSAVPAELGPLWQWWPPDSVYRGLVGGKHPRFGYFGYWVLSVAEIETALRLDARVFDEGVGYYPEEFVRRGACKTFAAYMERHWAAVGTSPPVPLNICRSVLDRERRMLSAKAPAFLPYFDQSFPPNLIDSWPTRESH